MDQVVDLRIKQTRMRATLSIYHCGHQRCSGGHAFGPAIRNHYLLHYVLSGTGRYYVDGVCNHIKAGEGFLICPGKSTYYIADTDDPWAYVWIGFDGYEVPTILKDCGLSEQQLHYQGGDAHLGQELIAFVETMTEQAGHYERLSKFYHILSLLQKNDTASNQEQDYFDAAVEFIYHNYGYDIKISDIARKVGIDRTYLYKIFMKKIAQSPQRYLILFRLRMGCEMLQQTKRNITEIAYSCGFKDTPSFCKQFRKQYQQTPLQYRRQERSFH